MDQKLSAEAVIVVANASRRPPPPCRSQVNGVLMCSPHESRSVWVCGQRSGSPVEAKIRAEANFNEDVAECVRNPLNKGTRISCLSRSVSLCIVAATSQ